MSINVNSYDPQSTAFKFYGNFTFYVDPDNTTDFCFQAGPVAVMNNTYSSIFMPLQCSAQIQRLLLVKYNIQTKTSMQSSWILKEGIFFYLFYDTRRQRLFGLRDFNISTSYILQEYNTTTLEPVQVYTQQSVEKYGSLALQCAIFDSDENWIVEIRLRNDGSSYIPYYLKMDLNLIGKQEDIVIDFHQLPKHTAIYTMTYDMKSKLVLVTSERGIISPEITIMYMNPQTGEVRNEQTLLKKPFGWPIQSIQPIFDETTRQVLFLIKITDLSYTQIQVWSIIVEFDTMKIIEAKQDTSLIDLETWTFFKTFN